MNEYGFILTKLGKSKFRSSFNLNDNDKKSILQKSPEKIKQDIKDILEKRIKIKPLNDGRQTPFGNYYVFTAQHATATCCRKCITKWHNISQNNILDEQEMEYLVGFIYEWIKRQI